jgi:polyhydroxyalkanoate synthesis regulator protein
MQSFTKNQTQMSDYFRSTFGGVFGSTFDQMSKQNMAIFEQAMRMFSPFGMQGGAAGSAPSQPEASAQPEEQEAPAQSYAPHLRPVATPSPSPAPAPEAKQPQAQPGQKQDGSIEQMQNRLDELQKQIASLSKPEDK